MGPTSAEVIGAAITTYVHARPTIRINILTACFIVCFSLNADPLGAGILLVTDYIGNVNEVLASTSIRRERRQAKREILSADLL